MVPTTTTKSFFYERFNFLSILEIKHLPRFRNV